MKFYFVFILGFIVQYSAYSQNFDCDYQKVSLVTAEGGLILRKNPSILSEKIVTISYNEKVINCYDYINPEVTIDNIKGTWIRSKYEHFEGFLFSGYLKKIICVNAGIRLIVPEDGSVDNFPLLILCNPYKGVYPQEEKRSFLQEYIIKPIDLIDTTTDYNANLLAEIPNRKQNPLFLISGLDFINEKLTGRLINKMYFPYETETIWSNHESRFERPIKYMVYAKGNGVINKNNNSQAIFDKIENYELWIRRYQKGSPIKEQLVFKSDLKHFSGDSYEGSAWIFWVGDLNGDKIPDIILKTSFHYAGWTYKLLLSNSNDQEKLYSIIKVGGGSSC